MQRKNTDERIRVLAIDEEYLIALDIQNILQEYNGFEVEAQTWARFKDAPPTTEKYDIVIIDPGPKFDSRGEFAAVIAESGARLIWSSTDLSGPASAEDAPSVSKPFSSRDLLEAIEQALSPVHPEKAREVAALLSASGP